MILFMQGYCDDFSGCTIASKLEKKITVFSSLVYTLFGVESISHKKTERGRKVVHIGWEIDLDNGYLDELGVPIGTISLSRRNLLKLLHGFFSLPSDFLLSRDKLERLASWMARYSSVVLPQLKPYSAILFKEISGRKSNMSRCISNEAINATIVIFPWQFTRPLFHLLDMKPSIMLNFDASLNGLGVRLF
jgi:hypothetical protein